MLDEPPPDASEESIIDTRSLLGGYRIVNMENVYEMLCSFRDAAAVDDLYDEMWDDLTHNMLCARPSRRHMSISSFRKKWKQRFRSLQEPKIKTESRRGLASKFVFDVGGGRHTVLSCK